MTVTNLSKSSITASTIDKSSGAQLIWNAASMTWDAVIGTWDNPSQVLGAISKSTITASVVSKS